MKKKITYLIIGAIIFLTISYISISDNNKTVLQNNKTSYKQNNKLISIMIETGAETGVYEPSTDNTWPEGRYILNTNKSKCENGGNLTWDKKKGTVILKANISDKCYAFFDVIPPSIEVATSNIPTTVGALANLGCTGSTSTYNQMYNRIEVSSVSTKNTKCTLDYTERTSKTLLNQKIIDLAGTTQGTGQVVIENGYRYEGKKPNNYVWFNNELWRIIGVFDTETHGQSDNSSTTEIEENLLVKIIREKSIGGLVWHKSNPNDWSNSSLKSLLNGAYYNAQDGTGGKYCYGYLTTIPANCNYTKIGIQDNYRSMIKNVTWHLGGHTTTGATAEAFYGYERGSSTGNSNAYAATTTGYIGLMYPSDYGYSVLASSCRRDKYLSKYDTSTCAGQSWLYGEGFEWTLSPNSSNSYYVFYVNTNGILSNINAISGYAVRPSLYLDANVYVIDGDGSYDDPYIIGM